MLYWEVAALCRRSLDARIQADSSLPRDLSERGHCMRETVPNLISRHTNKIPGLVRRGFGIRISCSCLYQNLYEIPTSGVGLLRRPVLLIWNSPFTESTRLRAGFHFTPTLPLLIV